MDPLAPDASFSAMQRGSPDQMSLTGGPSAGDNAPIIRVFVVLANGAKIIVPISNITKIEQLHVEAVRRATALKVPCTTEATTLRASSQDGPVLFAEDRICDVLGFIENDEFFLGALLSADLPVRPALLHIIESS
jgi:hypothetical protein